MSFEEAQTVFGDPLAKIFNDYAHSSDEKREIIVGHSVEGRLLIVCFTERDFDTLRIISARSTTSKEKKIMNDLSTELENMPEEYDLDYSKAEPNRFAEKYHQMQRTVVLDEDVAESFPSAEAVNEALRSLLDSTEKQKSKV